MYKKKKKIIIRKIKKKKKHCLIIYRYYAPKSSEITSNFGTGRQILHSIPVVQLQVPYIPTFIGPNELRNYHRPPLEKYKTGPLSRSEFRGVLPLTKHIKKKAEVIV